MILVYRALGLGDFLTGVPALRALVDRFGAVTLAAPAALAPLVECLPGVALEPCEELAPVPRRARRADVTFNLHGRGPQSTALLRRSRPRRLVAFDHGDGATWRPGEHEVVRWCRLLASAGIPADPARLGLRPPARSVARAIRRATIVHPGAATAARRWPAERFARVARHEEAAGRKVFVTGGPGEVPLARAVAAGAGLPSDRVLAGRTDLGEAAALVAVAGRIVCGDTGIAHLATALGTPSAVIFGPTSPAEWGPPGGPRHRVLWAGRPGDPHGSEPGPGLLTIQPEEVIAVLEQLPGREPCPRSPSRPSTS